MRMMNSGRKESKTHGDPFLRLLCLYEESKPLWCRISGGESLSKRTLMFIFNLCLIFSCSYHHVDCVQYLITLVISAF